MPAEHPAPTDTAGPAVSVSRAAAVSQLANDTVALCRRLEREDLAEDIQTTAARWQQRWPRIAVTGSTGAGRRSLVAAVVGRPVLGELGPSTVAEVVVGDTDRVVRVVDDGTQEHPLTGPVDADEPLVRIDVDAQDAPPVTLVLPPAVDALGTAQVSTSGVDAVLHVTTAARPVTAPELAVLTDAAERVREFLLCVTHVDLHHRWQTQAEASRALLEGGLGDAARISVHGTAAPLAGSDDDTDESGIRALRDAIEAGVVARVRALRLEAVVSVCETTLDELATMTAVLGAARSTEELVAESEAQLTALQRDGAAAVTQLADGCAMLRESIGLQLQRHVRAATADEQADGDELAAGLASAAVEVVRWTEDRLDELTAQAATRIGEALAPTSVGPATTSVPPAPAEPAPAPRRSLGAAARHVQLRLGMAVAQMGTASMFALRGFQEATTTGYAQGGIFLAAGLLGAIASTSSVRASGLVQARRDRLAARRQAVDDWRAGVTTELRGWLLASQREIEREAKAVLQARRRTLETRLRELRREDALPAADEQLAALRARVLELSTTGGGA